jgi:predicted  nucleic acid-binding Zn-ribbon protein
MLRSGPLNDNAEQVESELRELKMLKTTLESRLEEQRLNLEENEEAMLRMRKKNRDEIARIREQGNENLANVLADFKNWQSSVNEQHSQT